MTPLNAGSASVFVSSPTAAVAAGSPGAVSGGVRGLLQAEGLAVLILACVLYSRTGHGWGLFAALFLLPDLSFVAYLAGPRAGAFAYNIVHSYVAPVSVILLALVVPAPALTAYAYIWGAHIGFDRLMRYGLKYSTDFNHTHLGNKRPRTTPAIQHNR